MANIQETNLCFNRGDTRPFQLTLQQGGSALDITGFTFLLTVDPSPTPADSVNNLFQLMGTIIDAVNGIVEFQMSTAQADQTPGVYFYDVQYTDGAGDIFTFLKGEWEVLQDITK